MLVSTVASRRRVLLEARKNFWDEEETERLLKGVQVYGVGKWKKIWDEMGFEGSDRTTVDLRDRWRTLQNRLARAKVNSERKMPDPKRSISNTSGDRRTKRISMNTEELARKRRKEEKEVEEIWRLWRTNEMERRNVHLRREREDDSVSPQRSPRHLSDEDDDRVRMREKHLREERELERRLKEKEARRNHYHDERRYSGKDDFNHSNRRNERYAARDYSFSPDEFLGADLRRKRLSPDNSVSKRKGRDQDSFIHPAVPTKARVLYGNFEDDGVSNQSFEDSDDKNDWNVKRKAREGNRI